MHQLISGRTVILVLMGLLVSNAVQNTNLYSLRIQRAIWGDLSKIPQFEPLQEASNPPRASIK